MGFDMNANQAMALPRERVSLDFSWRFHLGDVPFPAPVTHEESYLHGFSKTGAFQGAARMDFDDSSWRAVDLPHDWVVEGGFSPSANMNHGYLPAGVGWYRKTFDVPAADEGRRLYLEFDGIYRDATVYLNGHRVGNEPSGYISVRYDVSDQVLYGERNVLAVRVDASVNEGWWYEGGGIYRRVWLLKTPSLHIKPWGVFVSSEVETANGKALSPARLNVSAALENAKESLAECELESTVVDSEGRSLASVRSGVSLKAFASAALEQSMVLASPALWSPESPSLYALRCVLFQDGRAIDSLETSFGVRSAVFDAERGFLLNGVPTKLKGTSNHQDHAGVGVAVPDKLHEFRILSLKAMGSNAWRCAHNPPAPEFLDACDRLGMLVMDETRCMNSTGEGMRQLESMLLRDRNHPSVIIWSLGNEEHPHEGTETGRRIIRTMKRLVRKLDPTRPVTVAMDRDWGGPLTPELDVQGVNYNPNVYDEFHAKFPKLAVIATESSPAFCTRGVYFDDPARCHMRSYDVRKTPKEWGHCITVEEAWRAVAERDFVVGLFPWTGFDYRGEPMPFAWPCVLTNMGILDLCGFPKDHFHYHKAWWSSELVLHIFPHWTWPGREGQGVDVWCYSNCESVELFLNGRSLGAKPMPLHGHLEWNVPYEPGVLLARGFKGGVPAMESSVETAGSPKSLVAELSGLRVLADGKDVSVLNVKAVDEAGRLCPHACDKASFEVSGPGRLIGVGNGDPSCHEPDKASSRSLFGGRCQAIVQSLPGLPGKIRVEVSAPGLESFSAEIESVPG